MKSESDNCAKMREALKRIVAASIVAKNANAPEWILQRMADIFATATAALAAPPRNCKWLSLCVDLAENERLRKALSDVAENLRIHLHLPTQTISLNRREVEYMVNDCENALDEEGGAK